MEVLLDNIGCIATVTQDYHPLTMALVASYKENRKYMPKQIFDAWDVYTRGMIALGSTQVYSLTFSTALVDDIPQTVYNFPELVGSNVVILSAAVEGIGVDGKSILEIDTETGDINYPNASVDGEGNGQTITILYKK